MSKITSNNITELSKDQIFVFGSNLSGFHGAGAAKLAYNKFGALYGIGVGFQGRSYAIPTKDFYIRRTLTIDEIKPYVNDFIYFVKNNPDLEFLVTEVGCGLAGHSHDDIAPLFKECLEIKNMYLPLKFIEIIQKL